VAPARWLFLPSVLQQHPSAKDIQVLERVLERISATTPFKLMSGHGPAPRRASAGPP
jgi:hypothetical protein